MLGLPSVLPEPGEEDPENAIRPLELRPLDTPLEDQELVTEGQILEGHL